MTNGAEAVQSERYQSIDVLRGFAVLGILVMNIQNFALPMSHYVNPHAAGELTGLNYGLWYLSHLLADTKFITIFSMLFGASTLLMAERADRAGGDAAPVYFRRNAILLVVGLLHAYVFWHGDVLTLYAMCAFVIFWFRALSPRVLLALGVAGILTTTALGVLTGLAAPYFPQEFRDEIHATVQPSLAALEAEIEAYQGGWIEQSAYRAPASIAVQTFGLAYMGWRLAGLMLIGMALYKTGVLTARRQSAFYWRWILAAVFIGLPIIHFGVMRMDQQGWEPVRVALLDIQYNLLASVVVAMGWISAVMLLCRASWSRLFTTPLAAAGRMALTNYLAQTLICTTLFYGHGFGWFGTVDYAGQLAIVSIIWAMQLAWSTWWMNRFRYGPAEWMWRFLTYGRSPA